MNGRAIVAVVVVLYGPVVGHELPKPVVRVAGLLAVGVNAFGHAVGRVVYVGLGDAALVLVLGIGAFDEVPAPVVGVRVAAPAVRDLPDLLVEAVVPVFVALVSAKLYYTFINFVFNIIFCT